MNTSNLAPRIQRYLDAIPPAVSGNKGHDQAYVVACALVHGFALSIAEAEPFMREYSARCAPPWSDREIKHKLESALAATNHQKRRGHLLGGPKERPPNAAQPRKKSTVKLAKHPEKMPTPLPDGTRALLKTLFKPDDHVRIVPGSFGENGKDRPAKAGNVLRVSEWLTKLDEHKGDPNGIFKTAGKQPGLFIGLNPMKPDGKSDADVTDYRYVLVEFDDIPKADQWAALKKGGLPCAAIIDSGGRSLHAWIPVDARDREEYDRRAKAIYAQLEPYGVDTKNKNPSRLSRLPNCRRGDKRQELLFVDGDAVPFAADPHEQNADGLPPIVDAVALADDKTPIPPELVEGLLHQGSKMVVGGGSKSYKSWGLLDLGLSVAHGVPWLGRETKQGIVLYLNFEIQDVFLRDRLKAIAEAKGIAFEPDKFHVWNLRGYSTASKDILPRILQRIESVGYSLIILDPLYKLLGDADENSAKDIAKVLNDVERVAVATGAAVAFGAHFSKGSQSRKDSMDRISGSGVFARDPDSILTFTAHESDGAYTVDATLRNLPPIAPFVIKWKFPLFQVSDLDPAKLKQPGSSKTYTVNQILQCLKDGMTTTEWLKVAKAETGIGRGTFFNRIKEVPDKRAWKEGKIWKKRRVTLKKSKESK